MRKVTYLCDRCGAEIVADTQSDSAIHYEYGKDLCDSCYEEYRALQLQQGEALAAFLERK